MPERDELDMLIDSALSTYAEPRPGLDQRTLARISGEVRRSAQRRILLAITAPLAVSLLLFVCFIMIAAHSRPGPVAYAPFVPSPTHAVTAPAAHPLAHPIDPAHRQFPKPPAIRVQARIIQRPKLDLFPTPQPLSAGEQALIHFVAQAPEADRKALIEAQQRLDEPLNISAIRIPSLQPPDEIH